MAHGQKLPSSVELFFQHPPSVFLALALSFGIRNPFALRGAIHLQRALAEPASLVHKRHSMVVSTTLVQLTPKVVVHS